MGIQAMLQEIEQQRNQALARAAVLASQLEDAQAKVKELEERAKVAVNKTQDAL